MNHPDWTSFVSAIVAEPDDDTPRLVAADFLEEHGEPDRAAFIRLQIELARLVASELGASREVAEARRKERTFLGPKSVHHQLWAAGECPELVRATPTRLGSLHVEGAERLTWRRGFVERVRCPAAEWLRHGVAVRARNPVREVVLLDCERVTRDAWYAGLDALRGLRVLDMGPHVYFEGLNELGEWLGEWLPGTRVEWVPF